MQPKHGTLTILEPALAIVCGALRVATLVNAANLDVVSIGLIPDQDLLGTLCTCALVLLAPDGSLGSRDGDGGGGACDHALEALHVNVGLTATVRNLEDIINCGRKTQLSNEPKPTVENINQNPTNLAMEVITYSTSASIGRTCRHVLRDIVGCYTFPRGASIDVRNLRRPSDMKLTYSGR